jgi:hypothetical protein
MGISLSNKPGHMAKGVGKIRYKCKLWCLSESFLLLWLYFFSQNFIYDGIRKNCITEWIKNTVKNANF